MADETNEQKLEEELADELSVQLFKHCEVCGTKFYRLDYVNYQYKLNFDGRTHYYCRYNCWRAAQKELQKRQEELKHSRR